MAGNSPRLIGLDVLRFFAASWVIFSHTGVFGRAVEIVWRIHGPFGTFFSMMMGSGWVAVEIFFVLSGFLVSGLLFQEVRASGSVSPGRFLVRRGFKIYPAFWIMTLSMVAWRLCRHDYFRPGALWAELLYYQNYVEGLCFHTWSLAVEEHFYFLLAGIFYVWRRRVFAGVTGNFNFIPNLVLLVAVLCLVSRVVTWYVCLDYNAQNQHWYLRSDYAVTDALFFGVLLSHWWHNQWDEATKRKIIAWRWGFVLAGVLLLAPGVAPVMETQWFNIFGFILIYLGAGCLLLGSLALSFIGCPFFIRWAAKLGEYSYSVYLWHLLVGLALFPLVTVARDDLAGCILNFTIYFVLCWVAGIALAGAIEFPVLRLRDRWFPSLARGK